MFFRNDDNFGTIFDIGFSALLFWIARSNGKHEALKEIKDHQERNEIENLKREIEKLKHEKISIPRTENPAS